MYDNNLIISDILELEEAGLDIDELAEMDWSDRFDAIDEAGLNPMDYDYGFLDDYMKCDDEPVVPVKVEKPKPLFGTESTFIKRPMQVNPKKMSWRERKAIEKELSRARSELETDLMMFAEVFMDD